MEKLSLFVLEIGNAIYRVYDLEHGYQEGFRKNNAYRMTSDLEDVVYPYRGSVKRFKELMENDDLEPGIYSLKGKSPVQIQLKRAVGKDADLYTPEAVKNLMDIADISSSINKENIITVKMNASGGDAWMPEIRDEDDATSMILKGGIRLKGFPFADYAPRLEADAVGNGQKTKGANAKSNSKRAIERNNATSMSKFLYYCGAFDLEPVIGIRDRPGARDPMFNEDGKVMVFFPLSEPYDLSDTVTFQEMKPIIDSAHNRSLDGEDDTDELPWEDD